MSYNSAGLLKTAFGGAISTGAGSVKSIYHYATNDAKATVEGTGYFDTEILNLNVGDVIMVSGDLDGTPWYCAYVVNSVTSHVGLTAASNLTFNARVPLCVDIADLSADTDYYVVSPIAGTVDAVYSVIDGAVSTADVTVTPSIGGTNITNGALTITSSASAAGDVDSATPTAANTITAGAAIKLTVAGGGSGGSPRGHVVLWVTPT